MRKLLPIIVLLLACSQCKTCFTPPPKTTLRGEQAYINVKDSMEVFAALTESGMRPAYRQHQANNVLKNPGNYNPLALLALGIQCLRYNDYFYGALYTRAAILRAEIDIALSQDASLDTITENMLDQLHKTLPKLDNEKFNRAYKQVRGDTIAWDKGTPRNYDRRWASLYSSQEHLTYHNHTSEPTIIEQIYSQHQTQ